MVRQSLFTRWFALVFLASLASELTNSLLVHFPGFLFDLGANELRIGTIVGVSGAASILVRPWIGRVIDRKGRRLMIRAGALVTAAGTLSYAFIDEIGGAVVAARVLQGFGQAMAATAFWAYVADRLPLEHRAQGVAMFGISGLLPIGVAPALGDWILSTAFGYQGVFFLATAFVLASFAISMRLEESSVEGEAGSELEGGGFFSVLMRPALRSVWFVILVLALGFTAAFVFVKTYVTATGSGTIGPFFAAYATTAILWRLTLSWVPDRVGPARMLAPGLALYSIGLAAVALVPSPWNLVVGGLLAGLGHGISFPIVVTLATIRANPRERGAAIAVVTALLDLALFGASPIIGWIIGEFGYTAMFMSVGVTVLVGTAIFFLAERRWLPEVPVKGEPAIVPTPHV